ncbi:tryptophan-rich sensory protein [Sporosarcina sp. FA9]|uniref:tryptophan-rich sensory protein n=1 Tax=Sporosarcina sp. FA9 TaxID=3413030 RepID=UPI003F655872
MEKNDTKTSIKLMVMITYLIMVTMNVLANVIPINGITTGEVSDKYSNLFAPAGYTFIIWGLIYILLAGYTVYQLGIFQYVNKNYLLLNKIGVYFSISSIANTLWILSWHFDKIGYSVILMVVILLCLIQINRITSNEILSKAEKLFIRLPFSVYFGWITVALIANITTYLVSIGWGGFGISEEAWTILILLVGVIIGTITMLSNRDVAYGLVFVWAYIGILEKHVSVNGYNGQYPSIIVMVASCILFLIVELLYLFKANRIEL